MRKPGDRRPSRFWLIPSHVVFMIGGGLAGWGLVTGLQAAGGTGLNQWLGFAVGAVLGFVSYLMLALVLEEWEGEE